MASEWGADPDSVLRSMFGSIVRARSVSGSATNIWNELRAGAYEYARSTLTQIYGSDLPLGMVEERVGSMLAHVTVQKVSEYVGYASAQLRANENLAQKGLDYQIEGKDVWTAPWAKSVGNPAIPPRYRARVLLSLRSLDDPETEIQEWSTYDLSGPLTNVSDIYDQVGRSWASKRYNINHYIDSALKIVLETV